MMVRGESCTGKTRTAFEAVRACLADWQLVFPKNAKRLLALLDVGALAPRTVLWLNEAQNFLTGTDGETAAAALHSRLEEPGPLVVLGTLWPEYNRALTATPQPGQDAHPSARALLDQAQPVDVPAFFAATTLKDRRVDRDRSLAAAVRTSTGGRVTQTLAAGPQLVDHYEQATAPHGPYGSAVITAAMDASRLGHTSPLSAALLKAAAPGYLTEQQRAAADPDTWFTHALDYARETIKGVAAALEPVSNPDGMGALPGVYRLSDYLDHHARTTRRCTAPPESFWTAARDHAATTADLTELAEQAHSRGRYRIAADLFRRTADAGDAEGAERLARQAADAGNPSPLGELARLRVWAGDAEGAERLARRAADAGNPSALWALAWRRERAGDAEGAERLYRRAADAGISRALHDLAQLRERAGDAEGGERLRRFGLDADGSPARPW
ncbi:tetratricopeptide repeat protein [Streptomyces sp. YGL11-2]|uniref:tetratricopeptide repeat protein n=1 Tax=Streptomyces sp. YGL11-2 TaxID=3414028 RepID=UPI003CE8C7AA